MWLAAPFSRERNDVLFALGQRQDGYRRRRKCALELMDGDSGKFDGL
jgi:hypothetical protein